MEKEKQGLLELNTSMTLQEVANHIGASYRVVAAYAQKAGWTENGKKTLLTEPQITVMLEDMKQGNENQHHLASSLQGIETSKSRVLKLQKLQVQMQEIYEAEITELKAKAKVMLPKAAYYDALVDKTLLTNFRDTTKEIGTTEKRLIGTLLSKKYIYRDGRGDIRPYADKMDFFAIKDFVKNGCTGQYTLVTVEGKKHLQKILEQDI